MVSKVTCFGTCRVFKPLRYLASDKRIVLHNGQFTNYTHSLPEILQMVRIMKQQWQMPPELEPYVFNRHLGDPAKISYPELNEAHLVICEVSTRQTAYYGDVCLQVNNLFRNLVVPHGPLLRPWFKAAYWEMDTERRLSEFEKLEQTDHDLNALEFDMVQNLRVEKRTNAELNNDIANLREAISTPVVLVTHCDVTGDDGTRLPSRVALIEEIAHIAHTMGMDTFQPSELIEIHGQSVAMADDGKDTNHYNPEFYPVVGEYLFDRWIAPRPDQQVPTTSTKASRRWPFTWLRAGR